MLAVPTENVQVNQLSVGVVVTFSYESDSIQASTIVNPTIKRIRNDISWQDTVRTAVALPGLFSCLLACSLVCNCFYHCLFVYLPVFLLLSYFSGISDCWSNIYEEAHKWYKRNIACTYKLTPFSLV